MEYKNRKLEMIDNIVAIDLFDVKSGWENYKEMIDDVYYNQKRRSKELDKVHELLNSVGEEIESIVPGEGMVYVEYLCQQMKKIVYLSWDTNKNHNFLTGVEMNPQARDALSFKSFKGFSDKKMKGILDTLVTTSFFYPDIIYHYLD